MYMLYMASLLNKETKGLFMATESEHVYFIFCGS